MVISGNRNTAVVYGDILDNCAREQIEEICRHPAFEGASIRIMPDCHAGKGCVIGFTAVTDRRMIVPNIVGVDIGCGILSTVFSVKNEIDFKGLDEFIRRNIPSAMAVRGSVHPGTDCEADEVRRICDIIGEADRADYHLRSIGSLGGGNHFIEIDRISDEEYMLNVHTGSRNLGKQICGYFQSKASVIDKDLRRNILMEHRIAATPEQHLEIDRRADAVQKVSRELAFVSGEQFDAYVDCMLGAKRIAALNRKIISDEIMRGLGETCGAAVSDRFDTIHNYIDWYDEPHSRIAIRKGAISAAAGERLVIPLNMHDGVIVGRGKGNPEWNCSAPHGSGRLLSRTEARNTLSLDEYRKAMSDVLSWSVNESTIDEAPQAYKPSDMIISSIADTIDIECIARAVYNFKA